MKSEYTEAIVVELGGLDGQRNFVTATYELITRTRLEVGQEFYSVAYLHTGGLPEARLGLQSPVYGALTIIQPHEWADIWIRGEQILLASWLTHEEFRSKAAVLNVGMPAYQFIRTYTKVPLRDLNPLSGLLEKV